MSKKYEDWEEKLIEHCLKTGDKETLERVFLPERTWKGISRKWENMGLKVPTGGWSRSQLSSISDQIDRKLQKEYKSIIQSAPKREVSEITDEIAVILLGDIHYGVEIKDAENNVLFNHVQIEKDIRTLYERIVDRIKNVKEIHLCLMGDIVEGNLNYRTQLWSSEMHVTLQIKHCTRMLVNFITWLRQLGIPLKIVCIAGNHGRDSWEVPEFASNHDLVIYYMLQMFFEEDTMIEFSISKFFHHVHKIADKSVYMFHGDKIKTYQGIPEYGIRKHILFVLPILKKTYTIRYMEDIDMAFIAHWHTPSYINVSGLDIFRTGGFKPEDEYTFSKAILPIRRQMVIIMDSTGEMKEMHPVRLY